MNAINIDEKCVFTDGKDLKKEKKTTATINDAPTLNSAGMSSETKKGDVIILGPRCSTEK